MNNTLFVYNISNGLMSLACDSTRMSLLSKECKLCELECMSYWVKYE